MKLFEEIAKDGKPLWKEIAVDTLKKAVATVVVESIKASIDLMKRERIRHDDYAFQQWKKAREEDRKKAEKETEKPDSDAKPKESGGSDSKEKVDAEEREGEENVSDDPREGDQSGDSEPEETDDGVEESEPVKKWLSQ